VACDNDTTPPSFGRGEEEVGWTTTVGNKKRGCHDVLKLAVGRLGLSHDVQVQRRARTSPMVCFMFEETRGSGTTI
jgi:hypothetical protein